MIVLRLLWILPLLWLAGCAANPATGGTDLVFMSEEEELKLGRELNQVILKEIKPYDNPALQRYVQEIGDRVTRSGHRTDLVYRFQLLDSPQVNAFALPGGYIYIYRGLLTYLNSEAELAAVLGHEAGHVTARHAVRQHRNGVLAQILATAVAIQTGSQPYADLTSLIGGAAMSGYGREMELEADRLGAEYLARAGYDIDAMLRVIEVLKNQEEVEKVRAKTENREPAVYHGIFATHPKNDDRLKTVVRAAQSLQSGPTPRIGREDFLRAVDGMVIGPGTHEGVERNGTFYHQDLGIALPIPKGWRLENRPDRVLFVAPEGKARIQLTVEDINKRMDGATFARERLDIRGLKDESTRQINGLETYRARYPDSAISNSRHIELAIIYANNSAFILQGANQKKDSDFDIRSAFDATINRFHKLTSEETAAAAPWRLALHPVQAGERYATLVQQSPLGPDAETELRLMNHQYPDGEPQPGTTLKLVR